MRSKRTKEPRAHFTAVWEFHILPEKRRAFEKAYGPNGDWARLFRRTKGHLRTELLRDPEKLGRYVTLDFWTSRLAFQKFKQQHIVAYRALDRRCKSLTARERKIGEFAKAVPQNLLLGNAQITVRAATPADIEAMRALEIQWPTSAHWSPNTYREIFDDNAPRRLAFVGETEDGVVNGFVVARLGGDDCELENIAVAEEAQRQGIGLGLVQRLKTTARELGAKQILLEVRESNRAARRLYERSGFHITGRRKSYYQEPQEGAVLYTLNL
jgi:ribosomal-protein-alanine acetyltransferase